jgi:hypothetical protein
VFQFQASLKELFKVIEASKCHYIRCLNPNGASLPLVFHEDKVSAQLAACGVVESIKIQVAGYPTKIPFRRFVQRYGWVLGGQRSPAACPSKLSPHERECAERIVRKHVDNLRQSMGERYQPPQFGRCSDAFSHIWLLDFPSFLLPPARLLDLFWRACLLTFAPRRDTDQDSEAAEFVQLTSLCTLFDYLAASKVNLLPQPKLHVLLANQDCSSLFHTMPSLLNTTSVNLTF